MKAYELMLMLSPSLDEEGHTAAIEKVRSVVTDDGGVMGTVDQWGKRSLAYEIEDVSDAIYTVVTFSADPAGIAELDRVLGISDQVLRHMIVRRDDVDVAQVGESVGTASES
jgi:small subunit ribosomal protein S6